MNGFPRVGALGPVCAPMVNSALTVMVTSGSLQQWIA